jgi:small ubiquitin-related modifier
MSDPVKNEPAEDAKGGATITIRVKEQAGEETYFKVKRSTKMSKVFDAFALRKGVARKALRFLLDGERVTDDSTPESLDLEENDQIDCKWLEPPARVEQLLQERVEDERQLDGANLPCCLLSHSLFYFLLFLARTGLLEQVGGC